MEGISKRYGSVVALAGASFELRPHEVMALLGENGAGKSTLVKILAGLEQPDEGTIELDGEAVSLHGAGASHAHGIAVVTQELSLVPTLSAAENVFIGGGRFAGAWSRRRLVRAARPYLEEVGLDALDAARPAESLSVAERQLVEVARLLAHDARILIFDEPTAALSDVEIERVKAVVRSLVGRGRAVVYVTHRLGEVFEIADRVTVLRNGESQPPLPTAELTMETLVERMLGRPLEQMYPPRSPGFGDALLELDGVVTDGIAEPVSLAARAGEIVGLAGQLGSGAERLLRAAAGAQELRGGSVRIGERRFSSLSRRAAIAAGAGYCSADRKLDGLFAVRTVHENLAAPALDRVSPGGWISRRRERSLTTGLARKFVIDLGRLDHLASTLSGGNQQKVALGKWLGVEPRVLLVEEPTRGVDVGARAEIYSHVRNLANAGMAVVFASSDLPEVLGLADTVATFYRGRLVRTGPVGELTPQRLMRDVTHPLDEVAA
jgi:ribose transport system ATP-binding protein